MQDYKPETCLEATVSRDPWSGMFARFGERYARYREQWCAASTQPVETAFPMHLDLDITDACNMDCPLCHQKYRQRAQSVMPRELLERIFAEAAEHGLCAVNFGASAEPLLQKELLLHGMELAANAGVMDIFLHTNGLLLGPALAERLVRSPVTCVCVSLDALTPETYRQCRGLDALATIERNVLGLVQARERAGADFPHIRVSFCETPLNHHERTGFVEKWKGLVDLVEIQPFRKVDGNIDTGAMVIDKGFVCRSPFKRAMIWPDGIMSLCCGYRGQDVVVGSLAENTVKALWDSEMFRAVRRAFSGAGKIPETCSQCIASNYRPE